MQYRKPYHINDHELEKVSLWHNEKVTDEVSFIPFQSRILALISSGEVLDKHRRELYDFIDNGTGKKIPDLPDSDFDNASTNDRYIEPYEAKQKLDSRYNSLAKENTARIEAEFNKQKKLKESNPVSKETDVGTVTE